MSVQCQKEEKSSNQPGFDKIGSLDREKPHFNIRVKYKKITGLRQLPIIHFFQIWDCLIETIIVYLRIFCQSHCLLRILSQMTYSKFICNDTTKSNDGKQLAVRPAQVKPQQLLLGLAGTRFWNHIFCILYQEKEVNLY